MDPRTGEPHDPEVHIASRTPEPIEPWNPSALPAKAAKPGLPALRTPRPARGRADRAASISAPQRLVEIVTGDFLLIVNPAEGSEVARCPADAIPLPERLSAQDPEERRRAAQAPPLAGQAGPEQSLLEREEQRARLTRLLAKGRSVRLTGRSGSGRSALLRAVADDCGDVAPDGVIRLSGYRRTPQDLLQLLFTAVYRAPGYRPDRPRLLELLRDVGAIVVLDDIEFGGTALEELVSAAPECAFLISATPDVPAPTAASAIEEVFLPGLTRTACLELLQRAANRPLDDEEAAWAADLWFESEGLPLRFVQAGALLRRRDDQRAELAARVADSEAGPFGSGLRAEDDPASGTDVPEWDEESVPVMTSAIHVPLPTIAQSAAPAALLVAELSPSARETLRFAVALAGECPNPAHLPALVGDPHADTTLADMVARGLAVPVASQYRLAAGVRTQLADLEPPGNHGRMAAQHFAWWAGHPSVAADRVAAESEALLSAMTATLDRGEHSATVLLARAAAPAFATALHWSAWERALRVGQESARLSGEVADEAYFHHELGVLALCTGNLDRARAELEASMALRGALADRAGTAVGRRTLAMVTGRPWDFEPRPAGEGEAFSAATGTRSGARTNPLPIAPGAGPLALPPGSTAAVISQRLSADRPIRIAPATTGPRRTLFAAGAGVLLAAVLGTVVTLGGASERGGEPQTPMNVVPADSDPGQNGEGGAPPADSASSKPTSPSARHTGPSSPSPGVQPGTPETSSRSSSRPSKPSSGQPLPTSGGTSGGGTSGGSGGSSGGFSSRPPSESPSPSGSSSPPTSPSPSPSGGTANGGTGGATTMASGSAEPTGTATGSTSPSESASRLA